MGKFPKGFSLQINGGSYGGFHAKFDSLSCRVCFGWLAITLFFFDVEPVFLAALKVYNQPKPKEEEK